jgi:hypothetical protein
MAKRAAGEAAKGEAMMHEARKRGLPDPSRAEHRAHPALKREGIPGGRSAALP